MNRIHLDLCIIWIFVCWVIERVNQFGRPYSREINAKVEDDDDGGDDDHDKITIFIGMVWILVDIVATQYAIALCIRFEHQAKKRTTTTCNTHPIIDLYDYYLLVVCLTHFCEPSDLIFILIWSCWFTQKEHIRYTQ